MANNDEKKALGTTLSSDKNKDKKKDSKHDCTDILVALALLSGELYVRSTCLSRDGNFYFIVENTNRK